MFLHFHIFLLKNVNKNHLFRISGRKSRTSQVVTRSFYTRGRCKSHAVQRPVQCPGLAPGEVATFNGFQRSLLRKRVIINWAKNKVFLGVLQGCAPYPPFGTGLSRSRVNLTLKLGESFGNYANQRTQKTIRREIALWEEATKGEKFFPLNKPRSGKFLGIFPSQ